LKLDIVTANQQHIGSLIEWFENQQEIEQWGGPNVTLTDSVESLCKQLKIQDIPSFSFFIDAQLIGFGQYYHRLNRGHLGRIGIAPDFRGKGYSHAVLEALKEKALADGFDELSLFVSAHNTAALRCYLKGGFEYKTYPDQLPIGMSDIRYMVFVSK
jgi:ribosomal protein S18 acetylase RimI-like enzyme